MKKRNILLSVFIFMVVFFSINVVTFAADNYDYMPSKSGVTIDKSWYVKFTKELDKSTINSDNIYIIDKNNNKIKCYLELQPDNKTVKVVSLIYYEYSSAYNLVISSNVKETSGKKLIRPIKMPFTTMNKPKDDEQDDDKELTICIDPGHGGKDSSDLTGNNGTKESDVDLSVALKLGTILTKDGINVVYTRTKDISIDNSSRFEVSNTAQADYFISIHCNTSSNPESNGFEVYYADGDTDGEGLASAIQSEVISSTELKDRGIKSNTTMAELKGTNASAVKVYLGFINNSDEEKKLADDSFQEKYAEAMAKAILECGDEHDSLNVESIKNVVVSIKEDQTYTLPSSIQVRLSGDASFKSLPVAWDTSDVNNKKAGTYTCKGMIDGYRKPVYATVIVLAKDSDGRPIICLDAGHGGYDPGAIGASGTKESDINLSVVLKAGNILKDKGVNVVYTRTDNNVSWPSVESQDLQKRCDISNSVKANYFVCVHCNSASPSVTGAETYYSDGSNAGEILAKTIQDELIKATGTNDRGIHSHGYYVLENTDCPAILTELGFISNASEEALLKSDSYQAKCAQAIAEAVLKCIGLME